MLWTLEKSSHPSVITNLIMMYEDGFGMRIDSTCCIYPRLPWSSFDSAITLKLFPLTVWHPWISTFFTPEVKNLTSLMTRAWLKVIVNSCGYMPVVSQKSFGCLVKRRNVRVEDTDLPSQDIGGVESLIERSGASNFHCLMFKFKLLSFIKHNPYYSIPLL